MAMHDVNDIVDEYSGRCRSVLDYCLTTKRLVDEAKNPGFTADSWAPLAELVEVDELERVGPFKEVMNWRDYVDFLTNWAMSSEWDCSLRRITESGDLVFLELEERSAVGDFSNLANSLSVYAFNDADKIVHIDVYLQMTPPDPEMLKSLENVQTAQ